MGLVQGRTYIGQVMGIKECADSFPKSTGGTSFCHKVTILLDATAETEVVQLCSDHMRIEQFTVNEFIKFKAHKQGKGEWTIHFEEKVIRKLPSIDLINPGKQTDVTRKGAYQDEWVGSSNPVIIGTIIDRAFAHSAHFLQMRGNVTNEDFITLVRLVADEMRAQHKQETLPF